MAKALDVNWEVLRLQFGHGMKLRELADKYGVSLQALKKRCEREEWMSLRPETHVTKLSPAVVEAAKATGLSLAEQGQAYSARMFKKISALAEAANLPPPKNWRDAEVADKIARRAAGLEHSENNITTIIGVQGMSGEPVLVDDSVIELTEE